jgi:hypothetical protein
VLAVVGAPASRADTDTNWGYSLQVPSNWTRIPDSDVQRVMSSMVKPGTAPPKFLAGYELASSKTHFRYPYMLVQVQEYPSGVSLSTISRAEVDDIVAKLSGARPEDMRKQMSDSAAALVQNTTINSPRVVTNPPGFMMDTKMTVAGAGAVHGRSFCLLGKDNAVFLHFYAKESEWPQYASTLTTLASGFRRTPSQVVTIGNATRTTSGETLGRSAGGLWIRILVFAGLGVIAMVIRMVTKSLRA